jgi:hypothetical protein
MCMICKGLQRGKFTPEEAREKLEEFVDLDLLDEDHQEQVETLITETEEEEYYWSAAQKNALKSLEDEYDYGYDDEYEDDLPDEEPYEDD